MLAAMRARLAGSEIERLQRAYDRRIEALEEELADWRQLHDQRLRYEVPVDQPLVLISQVQRSGGTLLSQLLDHHPQLHVHPGELHIGWPSQKRDWPALDLESDPPSLWWKRLRERLARRAFTNGYLKQGRGAVEGDDEVETLPMLIPPSLQERLFLALVERRDIRSQRDVLDAYMTSFFNAWLDYQNLYGADKRWVAAFAARTTMEPGNIGRVSADYPDGRLVSIVREPVGWYASAARHNVEEYADAERASALWRRSAEAMLEAKRDHPDRTYLMDFGALLRDTPGEMERFAAFLGIDMLPVLTVPTFNGLPIRADSSFVIPEAGTISSAPLARRKEVDPDARRTLEELTPLYEEIVAQTG